MYETPLSIGQGSTPAGVAMARLALQQTTPCQLQCASGVIAPMSSALQLVLLPHVDPFKLMYSCCNALRCCSWHAVSHVVFWEAAQPAREHNSNPENSNCKAAAMYPSDDQHPAIRQPRLDHLHACSCSCVSSSNLSSNTVSEGLSQAWDRRWQRE